MLDYELPEDLDDELDFLDVEAIVFRLNYEFNSQKACEVI